MRELIPPERGKIIEENFTSSYLPAGRRGGIFNDPLRFIPLLSCRMQEGGQNPGLSDLSLIDQESLFLPFRQVCLPDKKQRNLPVIKRGC